LQRVLPAGDTVIARFKRFRGLVHRATGVPGVASRARIQEMIRRPGATSLVETQQFGGYPQMHAAARD
jgi:hypothetical protein